MAKSARSKTVLIGVSFWVVAVTAAMIFQFVLRLLERGGHHH